MGITGEIFKALTFGGIKSSDYGIYITGSGVYDVPARDVQMINIPGRNGSLTLDNGRYENITITYPAGTFATDRNEFVSQLSAFKNALASQIGYQILEDDYNPDEYRLAIFKSGLTMTTVFNSAGEFSLEFECKPQRFLKSGDMERNIDEWGAITEMSGGLVSLNTDTPEGIKSLLVDFELTQNGTGDPSPTNVRDITGVSELYVYKARKNLLQRQRTTFPYTHNGITYTLGDDETVIANGTATGGYSYCSFNWNLPTKADTILTGCPAGGSSSTYELQITGGNSGTIHDYGNGVTVPQGRTGTLYCLVREGQTVTDLVFKPMMRLATDPDPTFVPFNGVRYYKDLGDTYYKGTYDFISGTLTLTHKLLNLTFSGVSATAGGSSTSNKKAFYSPVVTGILTPANEEVPDMYCNRAKVISQYANYRNTEGMAIHPSERRIYTYLTAISSMTLAEAQAWLADNPIQIVYPLETPEVIQLTGTSIRTLEGLNNIWSRNGGDVSVGYGDAPGSVVNPTLYDALPLIEAKGVGVLTVGNVSLTISGRASQTLVVDSELMDAYIMTNGTPANANNSISLNNDIFPVLHPGDNGITYTGLTSVKITPRWWTL